MSEDMLIGEVAGDERTALPRAGTRADELRARLEEMIVSAELAPGERLDEAELATRFGVSRTPVREALKALAAMGLVEVRGRQGVTVASISIPILIEMFEMMAAMEGLCAKLAARRASPAQKAEMRNIHARLVEALATSDPPRFYEINREFHEVLYDASHAGFIAQQTRALRRRVAAYRRYVTFQPGRMAATIGEHETIMQAIERADAEAAFKAASDHVMLLGDDMADFIAALPKSLMRA
ncbi:GntR family transcriptional regulator [Methylobrevis pamukkalensis]|uniref:Putative HTH-type transcriptional regulator YdfH n=1 Tax=Methylobrevis pamukkalensis TaxID=1439726 RepID=A0A1E3GZB0_9HYPH|nr:GntR family transcriptional regulator [Methylobrevis pamukkalensis]ODN69400.1 putative HTH-type transcriptional regulator YdfH [Methylobrevis pamukkalensis]